MSPLESAQQAAILFGASMLAGAVNSVAGGGTLLTFPALMAVGLPAKVANATSTVALWPGGVSSLFGYRREIGETRASVIPLSLLGLVGGVAGALLLLRTPPGLFEQLVPYLVLLATTLFMLQEPLARWQRARIAKANAAAHAGTGAQAMAKPGVPPPPAAGAAAYAGPPAETEGDSTAPPFNLQVIPLVLGIAVYGGYFGAGIGILTLATLGFLGFRNIHQMNGVKNIFTLFINGIAAALFLFKGLVDWRVTLLMAIGSMVGGYGGAGIARRIGQRNVRRTVILIGFVLTLSLLLKAHHA